jgi:hypothetical protein
MAVTASAKYPMLLIINNITKLPAIAGFFVSANSR